MKKIISFCLTLVLLAGLVCVIIPASAETEYAVGDLPYKTANSRSNIVISSGENLSFYDDFIIKDNIEAYSTDNDLVGTKGWLLQTKSNITSTYSSISINENVANVYGDSGKSLKFSYKSAAPSTAIPQGETANKYYHRLASKNSITVTKDFWDTAAIVFWIKTEKPVFVVLRCCDYSDGSSSQLLVSKEISLPAGENIVEIPLSGLSVVTIMLTAPYRQFFTDRNYLFAALPLVLTRLSAIFILIISDIIMSPQTGLKRQSIIIRP